MMAKSSNKVLGKGNKVDINEIEFVIMEDNNAASEIVETIIVLSLKLWKKKLARIVMWMKQLIIIIPRINLWKMMILMNI